MYNYGIIKYIKSEGGHARMVSHVAHHTNIVDIFGRYISGSNSECLFKVTKLGVEAVLTLCCRSKNGESSMVVIEMLLTDKTLVLTSRKNREIEPERVVFDLTTVFSYSLLSEMVHNYIETTLSSYEFTLHTELSCIRTVKPVSVYHKISQYARMHESIIHFFGTPSTRSIALKTNKREIDIFIDTNKAEDGVVHYYMEAVMSEDGEEIKSFFVKDSTDYAKALRETVNKL